jgi:DNA-binding CsgD family transcriptional regulator
MAEQAPPNSVTGLIGRTEEIALIRILLASGPTGGEALIVSGEPGIGKTSVLGAAAAIGTSLGFRILRAQGAQFEADLSFSGLHQLLLPLEASLDELSGAHRTVLDVALGGKDAPAPDGLVVSAATLALLKRAASTAPLLLLIDDCHWLDRASARVLAFVGRRLTGLRIVLLCATRPDLPSILTASGLPEHELRPLDLAAAAELLASRASPIAKRVRDRLLSEARGNPLALLELPAALTARQRDATSPLPVLLPLTHRMQAAFATRLAELPGDTRHVLLLAALAGSDKLNVILGGQVSEGDVAVLEPAETARFVQLHAGDGRLTFTHPLIRSTVVQLSTPSEIRRAQLALAEREAGDPDRRAWHLAAAALGPDETVAALLEETGHRNLHRGDPANAVNAMLRAAELSPDGPGRSSRLVKAAYIGANITGDLRNVSQLLREARRAEPDRAEALYAAATAAFMLLNGDGEAAAAHRLLTEAIAAHGGRFAASDDALIAALDALYLACTIDGRDESWAPYTAAVGRLTPAVPADLSLMSATFPDPVRTAAPALNALTAAVAQLSDERDQWRIIKIATAAIHVDRLGECRPELLRIALGEDSEETPMGLTALNFLCREDIATGLWDEAERLSATGLEMCERQGFPLYAFPLLERHGTVAALRGDYATAQRSIDAITQWALPRGAFGAMFCVHYLRALVASSQGDYEGAYHAAGLLSRPGEFAPYSPLALYVCLDLVESAVRIGKAEEARAHVRAIHELGIDRLSSRLALVAAGAAAMAAPREAAAALFDVAVTLPSASHWPFDLARIRLAYGEQLRRTHGSTQSAREHLSAALETFERLGAKPWTLRAGNELRAAGMPQQIRRRGRAASLTPQEHEIAMLAAAGLTNKQIAERVFLSDRTVGAHLYRAYPKLGIASRAALRDALNAPPRA